MDRQKCIEFMRLWKFYFLDFDANNKTLVCRDCFKDIIDELNIFGAMAEIDDVFHCPHCKNIKMRVVEMENRENE